MVTILLMNYKREQNLPKIIDSLRSQTVPCEIFLWNNSGKIYENPKVDWIINSSNNVRCWSRWSMVPFASNEYVMTLDDDLCFSTNDCLELLINESKADHSPGRAIGTHGVILDKKGNYYPREMSQQLRKVGIKIPPRHYKYPEKKMFVDILKGRLIFFRKEDLKNVPMYPAETDKFMYCDDIVVSKYLAGTHKRHHLLTNVLNGKIEDFPESSGEMALSTSTDWEDLRNKMAKIYFKNS